MLLKRRAVSFGASLSILLLMNGFRLPAQDPIQILPNNYWIEYQNAWIRVVHVHYAPKQKLPQHDHPKTPTLYVYLTDAGPVRFKHTGANAYALDRSAVKVGAFRLNPGVIEEHEVENISDTVSDFLRVEFKTIPFHQASLRGHFEPAAPDFWNSPTSQAVAFEDGNIRIVRLGYRPGAKGMLPASAGQEAIDLLVRAQSLLVGQDVKAVHAGESWAVPPSGLALENKGSENMEILRIERKKSV